MTQNSAPTNSIRPDDLMMELDIKKDTYYGDLKYLGIKADKDSDGKSYLTKEQADEIRALRNHVKITGKRDGFEHSSIIKVDDSNDLTSNNNKSEEDIYINPEEPTAQFDLNQLIREAAELKARELAMPHAVKREVANRLSEEDLPEDLRNKVQAVREAANPKYTPSQLADSLLGQWRSLQNAG